MTSLFLVLLLKVAFTTSHWYYNIVKKLPTPTNVKRIRSFLRCVGFYRRIIKDFPKTTKHLSKLLEKDNPFVFYGEYLKAFETIKEKLITTPIMIVLDWSKPFEVMYDASDFVVGAILG